MKTPLAELQNLSFRFGKGEWLLDNANLTINSGEFLGIIGPNGCGKTTILKLLLGLLQPNKGKISVNNAAPKYGRKNIGYVPQYNTTTKNFPIAVRDAVLMGRIGHTRKFGPYTAHDNEVTNSALKTMEIFDLADRALNSLSGGQLQKVLIARALVCEPNLLLLDEPTANLDPHGEDNTYEILNNLRSKMGIVIVSHDVGFVSQYLDRVACVNRNIVVHEPSKLSPETLEKLYGHHVHAVIHDHEH